MTHICVNKLTTIGSDIGLSPSRRQVIFWTNAGILLIQTLGTNFSEILREIYTFSFKKMHLKTSSGKCRPSCLGLNVLTHCGLSQFDSWSLWCPQNPNQFVHELKVEAHFEHWKTFHWPQWVDLYCILQKRFYSYCCIYVYECLCIHVCICTCAHAHVNSCVLICELLSASAIVKHGYIILIILYDVWKAVYCKMWQINFIRIWSYSSKLLGFGSVQRNGACFNKQMLPSQQ